MNDSIVIKHVVKLDRPTTWSNFTLVGAKQTNCYRERKLSPLHCALECDMNHHACKCYQPRMWYLRPITRPIKTSQFQSPAGQLVHHY